MTFRYNERRYRYETMSRRIKFICDFEPDKKMVAYTGRLSKTYKDTKPKILQAIFESRDYKEMFGDDLSHDETAFILQYIKLFSDHEAEVRYKYRPAYNMGKEMIDRKWKEDGKEGTPEYDEDTIKLMEMTYNLIGVTIRDDFNIVSIFVSF